MDKVKIDIDLSTVDKDNYDLAQKLLNESIIINIINTQDIDKNAIYKNPYPFLEYYNSIKDCIKCEGLLYCKKQFKGMCDCINQDLDIYLRPCKYKINDIKKYSYKKNIIINYMTDNFKDVSLSTSLIDRDNKNQMLVLTKLSAWIQNPAFPGYFIGGPCGTGKTHLLCSIINDLAIQNYRTAYIYTIDFVIKMREKMLNKDSYYQELERIKNVDILAFDDIGAEKMTEWARDELFMPILNYRMENKLITFFTSNESISSLSSKISNKDNDDVAKTRFIERIKTLSIELTLDGKSKRVIN